MKRPNYPLQSLRDQWLVLAAALLLLGLFGGLNGYKQYTDTGLREQDRLLAITHVIQTDIEQNLLSIDAVLTGLRREPLLNATPSAPLNVRLRMLVDAMPMVRTIALLDARGTIRASSRPEILNPHDNFAQRDYFRRPQESPRSDMLFVSPPFLTKAGIYTITVSRRLTNARGQFAGVIVATLDPQYFYPLLSSGRHAPDMQVALFHGAGQIFLVAPKEVDARSGSMPGSNPHPVMRVQLNIQPAALHMDQPLGVLVTRKLDAVYAPWWHDAWIRLINFFVLVLLLALGLYNHQRKTSQSAQREADAHRALQANEQFLATITDSVPGMISYWSHDLRCKFANNQYREWFGKTAQDMREMPLRDLLGAELFQQNAPRIQSVLRGEPQSFERKLVKADGSTRYAYAHYIPDRDGEQVKGFFVLISDIDPLKQAQIALTQSEAQLRAIIAAEPECVKILALDGTLLQMNRAGLAMIEADSEAQVVGQPVVDLVQSEHQRAFKDLHDRVARGAEGTLEFEIVGLKGTRRWLDTHAVPLYDAQGQVYAVLGVTRDVTQRKALENTLKHFEAIIESSQDAIISKNLDGMVTSWNAGATAMFGYTDHEMIGQRMLALYPADRQHEEMQVLEHIRTGQTVPRFETVRVRKDGVQIDVSATISLLRDSRGLVLGASIIARDITQRKNADRELRRLAQTDALTGLLNRRQFMTTANQELSRTRRYGGPLSVLMMDIDHFKTVNDTHGHQTGDMVIRALGQVCREALRDIDIIGRIGGEEFAIVLPQTDSTRALDAAERLRQAVAGTEVAQEHGLPLRFTVSIGVATLTRADTNLDTLLGWADKAMYVAKNGGRNRVCDYAAIRPADTANAA
jgi:diguanylate cyclase (GGDEF)-like protein/PAS domain S-box-containing protein